MPNAIETWLGAARLSWDCVGGVVDAVEKMHATIAARPAAFGPALPIAAQGIAGVVYGGLRQSQRAVAGVLARAARAGSRTALPTDASTADSIGALAALNGVCGDHLEASGNPLAIAMSLRTPGGALTCTPSGLAAGLPSPSPHVAVWVHGLGLSEQSWCSPRRPDMAARLDRELGMSPVFLRYNSGRHVSTNGREFSRRLDELVAAWPVAVESLTLIGHSMGGLVARSAGCYGDREGRYWRGKLRALVCLGTPHHGSAVERGGHLVTRALESSPYSHPLALARRLSAGIRDLRHGNLLDEDWRDAGAGDASADRRVAVPLLHGVDHYFAAATLATSVVPGVGQMFGDLLVDTASALGAHRHDHRHLGLPRRNCRVFKSMNHFDLLGHDEVGAQLIEWLRRPDSEPGFSQGRSGPPRR